MLAGHAFAVMSVAFSPDGRPVLTSSVDGDARLWSAATGDLVHRLSFHVATVSQATFSPDGQLLAAAFAPDSRHFVVGTATGNVAAFDCTICARTPALLNQANAALRQLRPFALVRGAFL
jgi:WD40 repeat protein